MFLFRILGTLIEFTWYIFIGIFFGLIAKLIENHWKK